MTTAPQPSLSFLQRIRLRIAHAPSHNTLWYGLLIICLILLLASIVFHAYLFVTISRDDIAVYEETPAISSSTINRTELSRAIETIDRRTRDFAALQTERPLTVDPSL